MKILSGHTCICNNCELNSKKSTLSARGLKTEYKLINENKKIIDKYIVDDCLLRLQQRDKKCDYLLLKLYNSMAWSII